MPLRAEVTARRVTSVDWTERPVVALSVIATSARVTSRPVTTTAPMSGTDGA